MKIVFLHQTLGLVNRGSEISTDLLASSLAKKHEVLVLQSGKVSPKPYQVKQVTPLKSAAAAAPTTIFDKVRSHLYLDESSLLVKEFTKQCLPIINKFMPDIIVATNGYTQLKILSLAQLSAKIVVFGRAGIGYHDRDNLKASPNLFVALTPQAKSWADTIAKPVTKVVYISNPMTRVKAKATNLNLPHPIVATVGALSRYKNIDSVIKAVSELSASLLLIGDGEESGVIADLLTHFPGDFRWLRSVDPSDMSTYYASSDIFCFIPDSQEAFGRVYLEAMGAGLPIVASDDPIRRGIIGSKGIYVNPHNLESVSAGIQKAYQQGRVSYSQELKPYQLTTVVKQIEKEFHDLIQ